MRTLTETDLRNAFIRGFATSVEGFNGECICDHLAPDKVASKGSVYTSEPDLFNLFDREKNPELTRLADQYIDEMKDTLCPKPT